MDLRAFSQDAEKFTERQFCGTWTGSYLFDSTLVFKVLYTTLQYGCKCLVVKSWRRMRRLVGSAMGGYSSRSCQAPPLPATNRRHAEDWKHVTCCKSRFCFDTATRTLRQCTARLTLHLLTMLWMLQLTLCNVVDCVAVRNKNRHHTVLLSCIVQ